MILTVLLTIPVLIGLMILGFRLAARPRPTPLSSAPPHALSVLHYNDGYDVRKTPRFVTRWLERKDPDTLTLFSGDILSPSLVSNYMKGSQFVPFLKLTDTQLAVPGNHEYDFGEEQFESFIAQARTKWLVANLKQLADPTKAVSNLKEHEVVTVHGYKVGVFGLVDTNWQKSNKLDAAKFAYEPFDEAAKRKSAELRAQGCDLVFVVSHMSNASDEKLLTDGNSVDVVFGGHDHIFFVRRLNDKVLLKSGTDFENFSHSKFFFTDKPLPDKDFCDKSCKEFGYLLDEETNDDQVFFNFTLPRGPNKFLHMVIEKVKMVHQDPKDPEMLSYIQSEVDPQVRDFLQPMVRLDAKLDTRESTIQNRETAVGNLFSDLARAYYGTDIGLVNAGIFKAEKLFDKNIFIRKIDLMKIFPYKRDVFVVVELSGQELVDVLEDSLRPFPKPSSRFLSFSGLTYQVDASAEPGKRVVADSALVDGVPIDFDKKYSVAMVSGLQHPQFGIELLKAKEVTTPEKDRLEPAALFEHFARLPETVANVNEFEALKSRYPDATYSKVVVVPVREGKKGEARFQSPSGGDSDDNSPLERLSAEALKRVRLLAIPDQVVNVDNRNIFVISPVLDHRFKLTKKIDI